MKRMLDCYVESIHLYGHYPHGWEMNWSWHKCGSTEGYWVFHRWIEYATSLKENGKRKRTDTHNQRKTAKFEHMTRKELLENSTLTRHIKGETNRVRRGLVWTDGSTKTLSKREKCYEAYDNVVESKDRLSWR